MPRNSPKALRPHLSAVSAASWVLGLGASHARSSMAMAPPCSCSPDRRPRKQGAARHSWFSSSPEAESNSGRICGQGRWRGGTRDEEAAANPGHARWNPSINDLLAHREYHSIVLQLVARQTFQKRDR